MKLPVYVHFVTRSWNPGGSFEALNQDMTTCGPDYVLVGKTEVDFDIPEGFDPRPGMIAGLREEKKKVMTDAYVKAEAIEERIQRLQALEFKPEAA